MKNKFLLTVCATLTACATPPPARYDLENSRMAAATKLNSRVGNFGLGLFSYSPPAGLGQFNYSKLGCLPCRNDGTTFDGSFEQPLHVIVKKEVSNSLQDATSISKNPACLLNATINMVGTDVMNGDQVLDITYSLVKTGLTIHKKRIKSINKSPIFGDLPYNRIFQKVSQKTVEELFADSIFDKELSTSCSN